MRGASPDSAPAQREVVDAFLAASHGGDFEALLALLDPEVVVRSDHAAVAMGAAAEVRGPEAVAATFAERRAKAAQLALVDGQPGLVWARRRQPQVVFVFTTAAGKVTAIEAVADPARLGQMQLAFL